MSVLHLNQIAGKSAVSVVTPEGLPATMWLGDFFKGHFDKVIAEGDGWPDDAEFKVSYRYKTWPKGWDDNTYEQFFTNREELDAFLADQKDWARSEDNGISIQVWEWDLGISKVEDIHYSA